MQAKALPALLLAALLAGGLGGCDRPADPSEPNGLPRKTVPMNVPPLPVEPPPQPAEHTVPPNATPVPDSPGQTPPLPIGRDDNRLDRPASATHSAQRAMPRGQSL